MTNLQAAIGLAQLERLDEFVLRKRKMGCLYSDLLNNVPGIQLPLNKTAYAENIYWVYGLLLEDSCKLNAKEVMEKLASKGIGTRPFCPMHLQPVLQRMGFFGGERYPVAERMYSRGLYVPSGLALDEASIVAVSETLKDILSK